MSQFDIFVEITNFINYKAFQYDKYGLEFPVFIPSMICRIVWSIWFMDKVSAVVLNCDQYFTRKNFIL